MDRSPAVIPHRVDLGPVEAQNLQSRIDRDAEADGKPTRFYRRIPGDKDHDSAGDLHRRRFDLPNQVRAIADPEIVLRAQLPEDLSIRLVLGSKGEYVIGLSADHGDK